MRVGRGQCLFAVLKWYENVCVCLRACVCVWTECTMLAYPHISSFWTMPVLAYTHTRILKLFEDGEPTGLKAEIAGEGSYGWV